MSQPTGESPAPHDHELSPASPGRTVVVALGGHAILGVHEAGTADEQLRNLERACAHLLPLVRAGHRLVVTHGNGPQVGNLLVQQAEATAYVPAQPLDVCVAMTQGQVGTLIERALVNLLRAEGIGTDVVSLVTHVVVDAGDPGFTVFSKPVGPPLDRATRDHLARERGARFRETGEDPARPFQRIVPSPRPLAILEAAPLRALSDAGSIVIAAGGGGIPLVVDARGGYRGVEAVVDKDLTSARIAESIGADALLILTRVEHVLLAYGTDRERPLDRLPVAEARRLLGAGEFESGTMEPKVRACVEFLERGGSLAVIAGLEAADRALAGRSGTRFEA